MTEVDREAAHLHVRRLLAEGPVVVLSGAGLSTSSGIPAYRDRDGNWIHAKPVQHLDFLRTASVRRRYWARSYFGWPTVGQANPTRGHHALARLEALQRIDLTITQNVDGLHQKAGSRAVLELHGGLDRVICLDCRRGYSRALVQEWLRQANPDVAAPAARPAPDGDALVADDLPPTFRVPDCPSCGGLLKPDVVFFGDSVPRDRVAAATKAIDAAHGLLVVGSSLMVRSGFRFVEHARRRGKRVMAVNLGKTRADHLLDAKVEQDCDEFLQFLATPG